MWLWSLDCLPSMVERKASAKRSAWHDRAHRGSGRLAQALAHMTAVSWCLLTLFLMFAGHVDYLLLTYYLSARDPFGGEMLEGSFWLTLYGFLPVLCLSIIMWLQSYRPANSLYRCRNCDPS